MKEELEVKQEGLFCQKIFTDIGNIEGQEIVENLALNSAGMQDNHDESEMGFDDNRRRNLGLRENPKKSWWVSPIPTQQSSFCEQCGKGFKSDKALFGHMRLHSKRKTAMAVKKIVEMPNPTKKKRSERRYKITSYSNSSLSNLNPDVSSSSVSCGDSVNEELEDIALCLLMLGSGGFCSFYAHQAFSDVDSMKMDTDFPVESAQNTNDDARNVVEVLNSCDLGCGYVSFVEEITEFHGFDRGFSRTGQENPAPGPSFDCVKNLVFGSETEKQVKLHDNEIKDVTNDSSIVGCLKKLVFGAETENQDELCDTKIKDETNNSVAEEIPLKEQDHKYICKICNRSFKSGQSLGGHKLHCPISRRYHPSVSTSFETRTETEILIHGQKAECTTSEFHQGLENRVQGLGCGEKKKRGRKHKHKCPVCCKGFGSGQALGGHMRAHFNDKLESNEREFDGFHRVSDPEIATAAVCGLDQETIEIPSTISEAVLVGDVAGV